ncbi:MAG: 4-(cytidine 5'-diphospho)-2-C-methyl-D-erythritol kinase, partial [Oscillospiraceae bacterium]
VALAKRPDTRAMRAALEKGDLEAIGAGLCNVFEQVAIPDHLELNYIKSIMMSYGAYGAQMTGSGSAVYGLFDSFEYAAVACTMLKDNYPQVFIAKTV